MEAFVCQRVESRFPAVRRPARATGFAPVGERVRDPATGCRAAIPQRPPNG
jgi:hypothetical protein